MVLFLRGKGWGMCVQGPPGGPPSLLPSERRGIEKSGCVGVNFRQDGGDPCGTLLGM